MKRDMSKMFRILALSLVIMLILIFVIWYVHPIHIKKEMNVCNLDSETAEIEIDIYFYRHLFKENAVRGTIKWDGIKYIDKYSKWGKDPDSDDNSFLDSLFLTISKLLHKHNENLPEMTFLNAELPLIESTLNSIMIIDSFGGYKLERVDIMYLNGVVDGNGNVPGIEYFGPANNQEEAQKIYQEFYENN